MEKESNKHDEVSALLISLLGLSKNTRVEPLEEMGVRPDIVFRDGKKWYVVEVANTASIERLSQLVLYQRLMDKRKNIHFILAAKVIPTSVLKIADKVGVRIVNLPRGIPIAREIEVHKAKLTTEKAWRVSSRLLGDKACSIRQIALKEGLSYGWAHAIVKRLLSRGIAVQKGNLVEIADVNALLDAVAWERPLADLRLGTVRSSIKGSYEAAETLTRTAKEWSMPLSFTAYTAASLYVGYGARHDSVYCYVSNRDAFLELKREMGEGKGIEIIYHSADRDVFSQVRDKEGILVVSPEQTLLDLAGLGYSARDFALEMVRRYASITEDNE
jgi:hypothetical protein